MNPPLHGLFLLDKARGVSSNRALQQVRRLFGMVKAGHTGTLDPLATGLLPICMGEATKFSGFLLDSVKAYRTTVRFGVTTSTGDAEGDVLEERPISFSEDELNHALAALTGEVEQVPPMYSALKRDGKPLYAYARAGANLVREPRRVTISSMTLLGFDGVSAELAIECSKGTYVRTIATDLGARLGCGAYLTELRRTGTGPLRIDDAYTLEAVAAMADPERRRCVAPLEVLIAALPRVQLCEDDAHRLRCGLPVTTQLEASEETVALFSPGERFIGIGSWNEEGELRAKRLLAHSPAAMVTE